MPHGQAAGRLLDLGRRQMQGSLQPGFCAVASRHTAACHVHKISKAGNEHAAHRRLRSVSEDGSPGGGGHTSLAASIGMTPRLGFGRDPHRRGRRAAEPDSPASSKGETNESANLFWGPSSTASPP